jgi:hypothetical protein
MATETGDDSVLEVIACGQVNGYRIYASAVTHSALTSVALGGGYRGLFLVSLSHWHPIGEDAHRQVVLVRPASTTLVLHVLHYPEQVRVCPQTVWPLVASDPAMACSAIYRTSASTLLNNSKSKASSASVARAANS